MGIWAAFPWQAPKVYTPFTPSPPERWEPESSFSLLGKNFWSKAVPSFPKLAFLVGQQPECQACLQEELQGCSWENRSSDTTWRAKLTWRFPDLNKRPLLVFLMLTPQSTPAHTSCQPCQDYPDKMIKLSWSTLVRHRLSQQRHYFNFSLLHPEEGGEVQGGLAEGRVAALPALLAAASLQKAFATSSHPSASVQTSEGLSDGKKLCF